MPDDVRRFLLGAMPSVPHLEALLLLHGEPQVEWTPPRLASRLYVSAEAAKSLLQDLLDRRILRMGAAADQYVFDPHDPQLVPIVDRLAAIYARRVVEIAKILHSKSDHPAQIFADAFRLRKDS
jgi:hypothetical protein